MVENSPDGSSLDENKESDGNQALDELKEIEKDHKLAFGK